MECEHEFTIVPFEFRFRRREELRRHLELEAFQVNAANRQKVKGSYISMIGVIKIWEDGFYLQDV